MCGPSSPSDSLKRRLRSEERSLDDGLALVRGDLISIFSGTPPDIRSLAERHAVGDWRGRFARAGILPHGSGVFVRAKGQIARRLHPRDWWLVIAATPASEFPDELNPGL